MHKNQEIYVNIQQNTLKLGGSDGTCGHSIFLCEALSKVEIDCLPDLHNVQASIPVLSVEFFNQRITIASMD